MRRFLFAAFFIVLILAAVRPLFRPGLFPIHDDQQVARLFELDKSLRAGQFPVRWVADLGFGFGYPLFNFYPPLVYYLGEFFHLVFRLSFLDSTKVVWGLGLVGSATALYFLAKELFGKWPGLVAAMFYLYAPYHGVDAYVRGALAELFSFVWLPLILLFSYKSYVSYETHKTHYSLLTGVFLGLLMLTHNLIFLPFFGFFILWSLALILIFGRRNFLHSTFYILHSTFLAFALTAFFWLPALAEKQFTLVDQFLTTGLASYQIHFVCPSQLWNSLWGYGGSIPGCVDGVSFAIGKIHILAALFAIFLGIFLFLQKKVSRTIFHLLASIFLLLLLSIFMTTEYSKPLWDAVQPLWYLQFPWRFLEFTALFSALLAGSLVSLLSSGKTKIAVSIVLIAILLIVEAKHFQPQVQEPEARDGTLLTDFQIKWIVSSTSFEYMTKGLTLARQKSGAPILSISPAEVGQPGYKLNFGDLRTEMAIFQPDRIFLSSRSQQGANLSFPVNNFPGWAAYIDDKPITINDQNNLKLITVDFPAGKHSLLIQFANTPVRQLGNIISLLSLLLVSGIFYASRRNQT